MCQNMPFPIRILSIIRIILLREKPVKAVLALFCIYNKSSLHLLSKFPAITACFYYNFPYF